MGKKIRKCFSLHFSHSLKTLALYVILFVGASPFFLTVPFPPDNVQMSKVFGSLVPCVEDLTEIDYVSKQMILLLYLDPKELTYTTGLF